jgi:CheY-like chemotaxis protein
MSRVVERSASRAVKPSRSRRDAPLPQFVRPQLSQPVEKPPSGPQWLHEIKLDGYRMAARIDNGRVQLLTRTGLDWTAKYPGAIAALAGIRPRARRSDDGRSVGTLSELMGSTPMGQPKPVILVVEDDELLRLHAAGLLEENGFGVVEAENADAALKLLETRDDVRLLFTDIQMPGSCNGMELARQVHARWPRILLVITSGQIKPAEAEIPDHGHFIGKPYRAKDLLGEVNDMMGKA